MPNQGHKRGVAFAPTMPGQRGGNPLSVEEVGV